MNHFWKWNNAVPAPQQDGQPTRELTLDGVIAAESWFGDEVTPAAFRAELMAGEGPVKVRINSPGGDCFAAAQIYSMDLFGKSAQELNPLIEAGGDKLKSLGDEAENAGLVMGGSALDALGGFDDAMQRFDATGTGLKNTIAGVLVPVFQPFVDTATGAMGQISAALADGLQPGELESILQTTFTTLRTAIGSVGQTLTEAMSVLTIR